NIFPNPASNQVYINLKNYNKETFKLDIYNQLGMNVKTIMINQMSNRINVSELSNGIYFLKIETTNGVSCKKLIIQK
ncbi:MAG: T9SS type A sorting domain-containing protein, partial [Bacteroidales bacterium]|nr:T9SS type A sorting domain-containing protein [Bacteroidales bacterium]